MKDILVQKSGLYKCFQCRLRVDQAINKRHEFSQKDLNNIDVKNVKLKARNKLPFI